MQKKRILLKYVDEKRPLMILPLVLSDDWQDHYKVHVSGDIPSKIIVEGIFFVFKHYATENKIPLFEELPPDSEEYKELEPTLEEQIAELTEHCDRQHSVLNDLSRERLMLRAEVVRLGGDPDSIR